MEETSLERDTDVIQEYVELLDARAGRPSPFGKIAASHKLGALRAMLARAVARHPDPELERAEAAATAEAKATGWRRFATSYWGSRLLMAVALVGGQQILLLLVFLVALAYMGATAAPIRSETGTQPRPAQLSVIFLVVFVFAFYFATPLFSLLLLWGGRFRRAWRKSVTAVLLLLLAASAFTWLTFRGIENPAFARSSIHQFTKERLNQGYTSYEKWLEANWLLKDPRFQADYERYLRNGPGRWLSNRFDTTDSGEWAKAGTLDYIGEFVDVHHDQTKFREWLADYVERNKIYSAGIESEIDQLLSPTQQRFVSIWQATPFLRDRDVHVRHHYLESVFGGVRRWGLVYFGSWILLYLIVYAVGPAVRGGGRLAGRFRFERAAGLAERARERYYGFPEHDELVGAPFVEGAYALLGRVHRSFVRAVLIVSIATFAGWAVWLAAHGAKQPNLGTQRALMDRFVIMPTPRERDDERVRQADVASALNPGDPGYGAAALPAPGQSQGPFIGFGLDRDGDGFPDPQPVPPLEARLSALQQRLDDSDWETSKRFKKTEALLASYKQELDQLRVENAALARRANEIAASVDNAVASVQGQIGAAAAAAQTAAARADEIAGTAADLAKRAEDLDERTQALDMRAGTLEREDESLRNRIENVETDLDAATRELRMRTERLGERATDLADRSEQLAGLQRTLHRYLVDEIRSELTSLERRSRSWVYRTFNKKEARARLADIRRRVHEVRALLQSSNAPEAETLFKELTEIQNGIAPLEERFD